MNAHQNPMDAASRTPKQTFFGSQKTSSNHFDVFGLKNIDNEKECVPLKTAIEQYFDI
jgi:hypothetical protein